MNDSIILTRLADRMADRRLPARRRQPWARYGLILRIDPVEIAHRYLRRFAGGQWHRGGSHVARPNFGPGIGIRTEQRKDGLHAKPELLRLP